MSYDSTRAELSTPLKNRIVGFIEATGCVAKAEAYYEVPWSTCNDVYRRFSATGSTANMPRSGRPPILSPRGQRRLARTALKQDTKPIKRLATEFSPKISRRTAQRVMRSWEIYRFKRRHVPFISMASRKKRMQFSDEHKAWTAQEWGRVFFTDETYIIVGGSNLDNYVTRHKGEAYAPGKTKPMFSRPPTGVMIWACIALGEKGPIAVMDYPGGRGGGMNASRYQEQVLERVFLPYFESLGSKKHSYMFQQDNAPGHKAKSTIDWFTSHGILLFPHPPSSPDLNPIELVWNLLKIELEKRSHVPTSKEELRQAIFEAWDMISQEDIDACIKSMPNRIKAVYKAHGGNIRG